MAENDSESVFHRRIAWLGLACLLFLRIPFTITVTYLYPIDSPWGPAIYQVGTYLLTVFLIWWERRNLTLIHIDILALTVIILFKPVQTLVLRYLKIDTPLTFPHPVGLLLWLIAIGLVIALWRGGYRPAKINVKNWAWLLFGLLVGVGLSVVANFNVFRANANFHGNSSAPALPIVISTGVAFLYQLGFASISEEPLFRGLLWGYLKRSGWKEIWIWIVQALIFMSAHLYFKDALFFNFWVVVPLAGFILGLFAWRSQSIAPGMMAHAAYNAGVYIILLRLLG